MIFQTLGTPLDVQSIFLEKSNFVLNFHDFLICSLVKLVLLILINYYMDGITPSSYGIKKPYNFPIKVCKML